MVITGMKIENYRNIELVDLKLDKKMNLVSGKNGAGKSSLVEAVIDAIKGKTEMGKVPQRKIKKGASKAIIEVDLGEGDNKLHIKRTITGKDVYLKAERVDGKPVSQTDLDNLLDSSTINVSKLLTMPASQQVDFVKKIAGIDTSAVENEYKEVFSERTVYNRQLKSAVSYAESTKTEEATEQNAMDLLQKIEEARLSNNSIVKKEQVLEGLNYRLDSDLSEIKILEETLAMKRKSVQVTEKAIADEEKKKVPAEIDISEMLQQSRDIDENNRKAVAYNKYLEAEKDVVKTKEEVDKLNAKLKKLLADREDIIKNSKLPFKNVEFDKDLGLIIGGIAFSEMSTAQQIKIISRIYIESSPELQVIYIKDGSLLDPDTLGQLEKMSELKDYQFLVEVVQEVEGSIIMREGSILGSEEETKDEREVL